MNLNDPSEQSFTPLLTICMPVFNSEKTLHQSLNSLLKQTFQNFKLIISDNASTDLTQKICEDYIKKDKRIEYFRQKKNYGSLKNSNSILEKVKTKYFILAASDDLWHIDFIKKNIEVLESNEKIVGSISQIIYFSDIKELESNDLKSKLFLPVVQSVSGSYAEKVISYVKFNQASAIYAVYRTKELQKSMMYEESRAWDLQLILNVLKYGDIKVLDEILMYRFNGGASSKSLIQYTKSINMRIYKILFPYWSVTRFCIHQFGMKFFLKNLLLFFKLNMNGSYLITLDILKIIKNA